MKFGNRWIVMISRLFIPLYFVLCIQTTNGQTSCPGDDTIGEKNTQSKKKDSYKDDTVNAVLNFDSKYKFDCCGFINKWEIFVRKNPGTLNVKVQVWYDSGTLWTLRGENDITATNDNEENEISISTGSRIRVFEDDYIGFYEYAGSVITYGNGGSNYKTATFASNETTYNWTAETLNDKIDHAINARITQSQIPTFTNLNDTVAISNNEVAGTILFTLATIDSDPEDAGLLTVAHAASSGSAATFFELDSTTSEVKIKSGVSLSPGNHDMTFSVTDPCSRSSSGILTIRVENDPPVITSLATNSSTTISEDLTTETLLHTLIVTDSTPTTCQLDSPGVPFQIKTISGSTNYGIFLSTGASMDYDAQNAYVLDLSCTDSYDATKGIFTVYLVRNEPPTINGLPRASDIQEDVIVEATLYTFSVTDPESTVVTCDVTAITPNTNIMFIKPSPNVNEFDILLQSNPSLIYDVVRTYRLDIQCSDGRRTDTNVFFMNVLRNKPTVFLNLQNITTVSSVASYIGQIVFDVDISDPENDQVQFSMFCVPSTNCPLEIYHFALNWVDFNKKSIVASVQVWIMSRLDSEEIFLTQNTFSQETNDDNLDLCNFFLGYDTTTTSETYSVACSDISEDEGFSNQKLTQSDDELLINVSKIQSKSHQPSTSRFHEPKTDKEIEDMQSKKFADSTMSKIKLATTLFKQWKYTRNIRANDPNVGLSPICVDLAEMSLDELNYSISRFICEVRKADGTEYPPDTLYSLVICLQLCMDTLGYYHKFLSDSSFIQIKNSLDNVMKLRTEVRVPKKQAEEISFEEEEKLWASGSFGSDNARHILNTFSRHVPLTSIQETQVQMYSLFDVCTSGEIVLKRSIEGEFVPVYDVYVYVTDGRSTTGPRSLTVHVLDINYVPVIRNLPLPSALVVSENSALGLSIFKVSIQDNDGSDTHTYSMTSFPSDGVLYFDIDSATGLISVSATTNVNYEAVSSTSFTFTITVSDTKDSASQNLTVTIANQNEAPVFKKTSYVLSVDEGSAGTVLADPSYLYQDEDTGDTHKFSMVCSSNVGYFSIAPTTGFISLATDIDVDAVGSATSYTCTVKVSDGAITDSASLTINVNNINDNTPRFSNNLFTYYLDINYALNTVFGSTIATDADTGTFGNFIYSIDQTSLGTETFGIEANGDLYLKNYLTSYGYGSSISITVQATDTGSLQGTATVFIVIPQTTTTTTTTTDRHITFWEYPANPAWVIVAGILGLIIMVLPCYMCYKNKCSCTWRGRPGDYHERVPEQSEINQRKDRQANGYFYPSWNAWKWYEQQ